MKKANFTFDFLISRVARLGVLSLAVLFAAGLSAQTIYPGSTTNQNGNSNIPAAGNPSGNGTQSCFFAATVDADFEAVVAGAAGNEVLTGVEITMTHTWVSDLEIFLESPTGDFIELMTDVGGLGDNLSNTVFRDGFPSITTGTAPFNGTFSPEGSNSNGGCGGVSVNTNTLADMTGTNGTWTLHVNDDASGDDGTMIAWSIELTTPCDIDSPLPALNLGVALGVCESEPIAAPGTSGDCAGVTLEYSVNGGAPAPVVGGFIPGLPASNSTYTITWSTPTSSVDQLVTVSDTEAPVLDCPGDQFINLAAGECSAFVSYEVTATDNCPFIEGPFTLATINTGGNAGAVGGQVFYNITTGDEITVTELGMNISTGTLVDVYLTPGGFAGNTGNAGVWNLVGTMDATTGPFSGPFPGNGTITPATGEFNIPAGTWGVALHTVTAQQNYTNGNGANQTYTDGNITINAGAAQNAQWIGLFQPRVWNGSITYQIGGEAEIVQTQGLPSGAEFPLGTTTNCFEVEDAAGNLGSCCFDVTVNEFPNATQTLACNDNVQVSLDENCTGTIGADMILEGGPYGCYDTRYTVMVLGPLNQPLGNVVNDNFIGNGPWTVKVTDNETGQSCWGSIVVEDKIKPVVSCEDLELPCTAPSTAVGTTALFATVNTPVGILDNQTVTADIPVAGIPADARILDVDATFDIDHTWIGDLNIDVISPAGTRFRAWNQLCGPTDNFKVTLDDEDPDCSNPCVDYTVSDTLMPAACLLAQFGPFADLDFLSVFDGEAAAGDWTVVVEDGFGGDQGTINNVELAITYFSACAVYQPDVVENCGAFTLESFDAVIEDECGGPSRTIVRTWIATDEYGNESDPCTQTITFVRPTLDDVDVPLDVTWDCKQYAAWDNITDPTHLHPFFADCDGGTAVLELTCYDWTCNDNSLNGGTPCDDPKIDNTTQGACTSNPAACGFNGLENQDIFAITGSGVPTVSGAPLEEICDIGVSHEDITIEVCPGTFKIVRKWTLVDWCADPVDVREINQVIKVVDETAPTIAAPDDLTIDVYDATEPPNAGPHAVCAGSVIVPEAGGITDDCSGIDGYTTEIWTTDNAGNPAAILGSIAGNGGVFSNIPLYQNGTPAQYVVRYYAIDGCGNQSFDDMSVTLRDKVPPVAVCDEITEVSITNNGVATGESCSTLFAEDLDDGSYDNCAPVHFLMAKMDDSFSQDIFTRCYYPSRDFCCEDLGEQTVILLVLDGDPSPFFSTLNSPALGCDGTPGLFLTSGFSALNYNVCMVTVEVTDKLSPILISCPNDQRITCDYYADNLETQLANAADDEESCAIMTPFFGEAEFFDNCSLNVTCSFNNGLDQCLEGILTRTWSAEDDAGNSGLQSCTQRIFVDHVSDWVVEFPADITVECGTSEPDFGEPEIFFETCELVGVSYEDEVFNVVADACYKVLRTWTVINWCVVGQEIDEEIEEDPENQLGLPFPACDLDGDGDCDNRTFRDSWASGTYPGAGDATTTLGPDTDFDSDPWDGYITYQQVIKVNDTVDPVFTNGCEIPDVCIEDNTCGATVLLPTPEIEECSDNVTLTAQINIGGVWLDGFGPYLNVAPGTYDVRYVAMDNCNNQTDCQTTVTVADCKKPTPYCKNGIIVELMVTADPMVEVWATDLDDNSFDNCPGALKFSFSSNVNDDVVIFTCDDVGQQPVQLWVTDAAGNQDFCETFVIVQANMGQCPGDDPLISGATATEEGEGVEGVNININSPAGMNYDVTTDVAGTFSTPVAGGQDYTVTPVYDEEPLNGVSTFDLVLISKHILGVQPLDSPYKLIAADANKSNSITTFDMLTIRKLILFIDTEFPNNTSWRFFNADCDFANPADPFSNMCQEVINLNDVTQEELNNNFVAVKIGDVNGSASTNLLGSTEDRTMVGDLVFDVEDINVQEGEYYTVDFKATDFVSSGYQFTLNFDNNVLDFVEVGAGLADASNFGLSMVEEGVLTASWNSSEAKKLTAGDVVFSLTFQANSAARLSDAISLNSRYTVAEAYNADAQLLNVALSFNSVVVANGFDLYQNTPNPFASTTNIGFYLPEATSATLTISDVQGKVVYVQEGDYAKGYNQVTLEREQLNANGVLYYRLDTDTESATRKMILVD